MRVILTGVTGMVGEGVLLECLESDSVEKVLTVSRKPTNHTHPKLEQLLVPDFRNTSDVEAKLTGYDACFVRALTLSQVGRAMIRCAQSGASKPVLEIPDIAALAETTAP